MQIVSGHFITIYNLAISLSGRGELTDAITITTQLDLVSNSDQ